VRLDQVEPGTNDELLARLRPGLEVGELDAIEDDERTEDRIGVLEPECTMLSVSTSSKHENGVEGTHSAKPKGWGLPVAPRTRFRLRS
jgi:hypothetical protein